MVITSDDIVRTMASCFITAELPAFTIRNLETHLEDINILRDKEINIGTPIYITDKPSRINDVLNHFADLMSHMGWESSFNILNTLRFRFQEKAMLKEQLSIKEWLVIVRRVIGTVNTTLRNKGILLDV